MGEGAVRQEPAGVWQRVWDEVTTPIDRVSEATYGVIMTLTIVSVLPTVGDASREALLLAAMGCNLAWGLVDALMLLVRLRVESLHKHNRLAALRQLNDEPSFRAGLEEFLPGVLLDRLPGDDIWGLRQQLLDTSLGTGAPPRPGAEVYLAALLVVALVFCSTLPLVLPLWLIGDQLLALRVAQGVGLGMLLLLGVLLARWAGDESWLGAVGFAVLGLAMTLLCILLGG